MEVRVPQSSDPPERGALLQDGRGLGPRQRDVLDEDTGGSVRHLRQRDAVHLHRLCVLKHTHTHKHNRHGDITASMGSFVERYKVMLEDTMPAGCRSTVQHIL